MAAIWQWPRRRAQDRSASESLWPNCKRPFSGTRFRHVREIEDKFFEGEARRDRPTGFARRQPQRHQSITPSSDPVDDMADNVEAALSKIRPHTSSSLAHQKAPATLLRAIEATFREQNTGPSATAYFAALLTTLDGALQSSRASGPALGDGDVLPAVLYLLAAVAPHVPHPVIRSNLSTIITLTSPLFPALSSHAPPLRSQLALYGTVILTLDRPHLDMQGLRQAFITILQLVIDPRPKVRKKASEVVKDVLAAPPPPAIKHPYAEKVAEWIKAALAEVSQGGLPKFKGKKAETEGSEAAIHLLALLRPVLPTLPSEVSDCLSNFVQLLIWQAY